ncbi:Ubiquinone biosynthesis O-methyltransferase, mitochondrial [Schistosoma japonicum]|nr:Ubiquinone biosynthesis O-methyltransferase, mitochondrial [Schistosoma japonicum]
MSRHCLCSTVILLKQKCYPRFKGIERFQNFSRKADETEAMKFKLFAEYWWDPNGDLQPLHAMNRLRVPFIRNGLCPSTAESISDSTYLPLKGKRILDVGCGGGILTEVSRFILYDRFFICSLYTCFPLYVIYIVVIVFHEHCYFASTLHC